MFYGKGMLFPIEEKERWAEKYNIEPIGEGCRNCGVHLWTTIPFATKGARGLVSPPCDCGNEKVPLVFVKAKKRKKVN